MSMELPEIYLVPCKSTLPCNYDIYYDKLTLYLLSVQFNVIHKKIYHTEIQERQR